MIGRQKTKIIMMTEGITWKQLLAFSMPLLMSNLFQQLYNTVDSVVVGSYIGSEALAAVGFSNSLINLIIGMFMGIAIGASVIISQHYGGREEQKLHWAVHTCMALSTWGGIFLTALGIAISSIVLEWMGIPEEVMSSSVVHFRIFFGGSLSNLVYNMGAGILRVVGDPRRPLYCLCVSSMVNIVLDLVFVVVFHMGVADVDYATVTAQSILAMLVMLALTRSDEAHRLELSKIKIDKRMISRILKIDTPGGVQQSIISLSNMIVQANANSFGAAAMVGFGFYCKIDGPVMLPLQSFCMAATTFTGQSVGARNIPRVRKGIFQGLVIGAVYTAVMLAVLFSQMDRVLRIFSFDPAMLEYGHWTMYLLLPPYMTITVYNILMDSPRGAGKTTASVLVGTGNMCILRMIYINLTIPFLPSYGAIMLCYPITWTITTLTDIVYCVRAKWLPRYTITPEPAKLPCPAVETVQKQ